ncbi:hypothetical protein CBS147330_9865 [Penicillium roqueforti]|nr:hypothetical protein CBS147330_9865 [Penicillium roqueforti]
MSRSVFYCTEPSTRVAASVPTILTLISFHSAFFSSSRSDYFGASHGASKTVSMVQWSEPCSVPWTAHLIIESVKFSEARARSIVDSQSPEYPPHAMSWCPV